jgi:hypothetical protein
MWNAEGTHCSYGFPKQGKVNNFQAVQWISEACKKFHYDIVVTSTWRRHDNYKECLINGGLREGIEILGKTEHLEVPEGWSRGHEIHIVRNPKKQLEVTVDGDLIAATGKNDMQTVLEEYYDVPRLAIEKMCIINFNAFSLIANVTYGNQSILLTGDIEECVEEQYAQYMKKATIMTAPHHGVNIEAYEAFYTATSPEVTICQFVTSSANWVESYYKEFYYIVENSKKVVTCYSSKSDDEFYSFELDGDSFVSNVKDGGLSETSPEFKLGSYIHVDSLIDLTTTAKDAITFKQWVLNLPKGAKAEIPFYQVYATRYAQLVTDIKVFYPDLHPDFVVKISRDSTYIFITIEEMYNSFAAEIHVTNSEWNTYDTTKIINTYMDGKRGEVYSENETQFLTRLGKLPSGTYKLMYKDASNSDLYNGTYEGIVTLRRDNASKLTGFFTGHIKNNAVTTKSCINGYFDSSATDKVSIKCW